MDTEKDEQSSSEDLESILKKQLRKKDPSSPVVLDLRGNPGGYLEEAISMAGLFLGPKVVTGVVEKKERRVLRSSRTRALYSGPLVLWLDNDSASASEVLAGALKDHGRALIVGATESYGKGSVQRLFHLADDIMNANDPQIPSGVVKLTTSYFFSPLGHNPSNGGVVPDVRIATAKLHATTDPGDLKPVVADTVSFLNDWETQRLAARRDRVRTLVKELLQKTEGFENASQGKVSEEMTVVRYGELYAELQKSE